ncbi:ATP-grasp domain-containing protein [bacterium]|nr:ATP-grasp domain-containing protein [bacterium]
MIEKKLMVLGASLYQLEAIGSALDSGLTVITVDNRLENPGHRLAHNSYNIDTTDIEAVFTVAVQEGIAGIIAPATDVALPTAAVVAERLGLPGPGAAAAATLCHKVRFRDLQKKLKLPSPKVAHLKAAMPDHDLFTAHPWIIKPTRSSGSKGIFIIKSLAQYLDFLPQSRLNSLDGEVVLEEYIEGFQGTVEGVLSDYRVSLAFFLDRRTALPPYVATHGHHLPTLLAPHLQARIVAQLEVIFQKLAVKEGPFDADFVVSADSERCSILEMAPRLGGNSISRLIALATGFDLVDFSIKTALGLAPELPVEAVLTPTAVCLLGVEQDGLLAYDQAFAAELETCPWIHDLDFEVAPLTPVKAFINGRHRVGQLFIQAPTRALLDARVEQVLNGLTLTVDKSIRSTDYTD